MPRFSMANRREIKDKQFLLVKGVQDFYWKNRLSIDRKLRDAQIQLRYRPVAEAVVLVVSGQVGSQNWPLGSALYVLL